MKRSTIEWHSKLGDLHPVVISHLVCTITDAEFVERVGRIKDKHKKCGRARLYIFEYYFAPPSHLAFDGLVGSAFLYFGMTPWMLNEAICYLLQFMHHQDAFLNL